MNNKTLYIALLAARGVIGLCILFFLLFLVVIIWWHIEPEAFHRVDVSQAFLPGFGVGGIQVYLSNQQIPTESLLLSKLSPAMLYWTAFRALFFFIISLLILRKVAMVLQSLKSLDIFYQSNIIHFKHISVYAFLAFLFSSINGYWDGNTWDLDLKIVFAPLLFSIGSAVLAEVFREGYKLSQEQKLII